MSRQNDGKAVIQRGAIVIRLPIKNLPTVLEGAWAAGGLKPRYKITNVDEFAADLVNELNSEEEDGTTRVHTMFDKAIEEAIGQGAFGIEQHPEQED